MIIKVLDFNTRAPTHNLICSPELVKDYSDDWFSGYLAGEIVTFFGEGEYLTLKDISEGYTYKLDTLAAPSAAAFAPERKIRLFKGYYYHKNKNKWAVVTKFYAEGKTKYKLYAWAKTEEEARQIRESVKHLDQIRPSKGAK